MNGGSCFATASAGGAFKCVCAEGFSGGSCEVDQRRRRMMGQFGPSGGGGVFDWEAIQ